MCVRDADGVETTDTHLTNFFFDGARADLTKGLSMEPVFQVTHSFSLASQTSPSMYNFGAIFANANVRVFPSGLRGTLELTAPSFFVIIGGCRHC